MHSLSLIAADRRFRWCLALSVLLTTAALTLLGRLLEPRPQQDTIAAALHPMRIAILPPPPKPVIVKRVSPKPIKKIPPRRIIVKRPVIHVTRPRIVSHPPRVRRATLQRASPRPNPQRAARPAAPGGASSAAPVMAAPATTPTVTPPKSTASVPVMTTDNSPIAIPLQPPTPVDAPPVPTEPAPITSGGSGASAGQGSDGGSGQGRGDGQGAGIGTGGGPFGIGSGGTGTGEGSRHVVYVLDISGSMTSRIDRARRELDDSLESLQPGETFDIITFSNRVHYFDFSMNHATPFLIKRAEYFLTTIQVSGGTNLEGALTHALQLKDVNVIFVITDGVPTIDASGQGIDDDLERYMRTFPRFVRNHNVNDARIYTIGLVGKDPDGRDESFAAAGMLAQIARDSGGVSKVVSLGDATP